MTNKFSKYLIFAVTLPIIMGLLWFPTPAHAGLGDIFGNYGFGSSSSSGSQYDSNSVIGQHTGEIRLSKRVRRVARDQDYHETTVVRSGDLVEVWIEVKNTSNSTALVNVTDQLGGSVVYKKNSLKLNGQSTPPGLTSGGIGLSMPASTTAIITYQIYVCSGSTYTIRANAYAAGIGSATDAVIIQSESQQYSYSYSNNDVGTCMNQFQNLTNTGSVNQTTYNSTNSINSNPNNPFGNWTGVNNATSGTNSTTNTNPTTNNPFGGWTGVQNNGTAGTASNPFGEWTGVQNSESVTNPFGDWTGVSNSGYDMRGYTTSSTAQTNTVSRTAIDDSAPSTYFVAPTTGVNKMAPLWFAGLLIVAFVVFKKRKLIFT